MRFVAPFSLFIASASASALFQRDGETKTCQFFDSVQPSKATCNDPADTFCPGGCKGAVVSENCKQLNTYEQISGNVTCDGAFTKSSGKDYFACEGGKVGSVICYGPFSGSAVCSGCRPLTADDKKSLGQSQSPDTIPGQEPTGDVPSSNQTGGNSDNKTASTTPEKQGGWNTNSSTSNSTAQATTGALNQTGSPSATEPSGSTEHASTPDSPAGAEALIHSVSMVPVVIALLIAGFSTIH